MRIVFFIVALLALAFWGFCVFDMWATLNSWPPYVDQYGADMFAWIQGFPIWRKAIWGASLGFGLIGSFLLFTRDRLSGPALLIAWLLLASGFGYDLVFQDGVRNYGQDGLIASGALVALAALFSWVGFASSGRARTKPPVMTVAPTAAVPQPEPVAVASPPSEITPPPEQQSEPPTSEPALTQADPVEPEPPVAELAPPSTDPAPSQVDVEEPSSPAAGSESTAHTPSEGASPTERETEDDEPSAPAQAPEDKPTAG